MSDSTINRLTARVALATLLMLCSCVVATAGSTIKEYSERLEKAEAIADQMIDEEPEPEDLLAAIALIRQLVPRSEEVTNSNQNFKVDNNWLHFRLDDLAKIANGDPEQQRSMLIEVADRLFVLQERINSSIRVEDRKAQLDAILNRNEYRPDEEKESTVRKWLRTLWGFIARLLDKLPRPKAAQTQDSGRSPFRYFSLALGLLILGAVGIAIFRLLRKRRGLKKSLKEDDMRVVFGEAIPDDVTSAELFRKAAEIAGRGDYRSAIRGAYIALLCELDERGKLSLHKSRTNRDYTDALRGDQEIFRPFTQMTGRFEESWYGQVETSNTEFEDYLNIYRTTFGKTGAQEGGGGSQGSQ